MEAASGGISPYEPPVNVLSRVLPGMTIRASQSGELSRAGAVQPELGVRLLQSGISYRAVVLSLGCIVASLREPKNGQASSPGGEGSQ